MGGLVSVITCIAATAIFYSTPQPVLLWVCVVLTAASLSSWRLMRHLAMQSAKLRRERWRENFVAEGRSTEEMSRLDKIPVEIEPRDLAAVPNRLAVINMVITFAGIGMLVWAIILKF